MNATYTTNGFASEAEAMDWDATMATIADQERYPVDLRHPCSNANCDRLTEACFCSEDCREAVEGPDHEDASSAILEPSRGSDAVPLGEAPVSMNVHVPICGRDVLITLRGVDEGEVLARLEALLARYPVAQAPAQTPAQASTPTCPTHGAMKPSSKGTGWYCPAKSADGSGYCKERRHG